MLNSKVDKALLATFIALLGGLVYVVTTSVEQEVVAVGSKAPPFRLTTDQGITITPTNFGGKLLVLNFWATWCPPCLEEIPSLSEFQRRYRDKGVVVVAVSVDEDEEAYRNFLEHVRVSFLTARDPGAELSVRFGTFKFPETYIIGPDGRVLQKVVGAANWLDPLMIQRIEAVLRSSS